MMKGTAGGITSVAVSYLAVQRFVGNMVAEVAVVVSGVLMMPK